MLVRQAQDVGDLLLALRVEHEVDGPLEAADVLQPVDLVDAELAVAVGEARFLPASIRSGRSRSDTAARKASLVRGSGRDCRGTSSIISSGVNGTPRTSSANGTRFGMLYPASM